MGTVLTTILTRLKVRNIPSVKKIFAAVVGTTVLAVGLALIVLPGPAIVVIPIGLAILASEFVWARRWLDKARQWIDRVKTRQDAK